MPQNTRPIVEIDGVDVTEFALEGSVTTRLNGAGTATVRLPMTAAIGGAGSYLKIYFETDTDTMPILWHHGRCMTVEDSADEDFGYTVYNSSDPLELWNWRPVRDSDGDFSNPGIIADNIYGPLIIYQMILYSESTLLANPDAHCEGPTRLQLGHFDGGVTDLTGTPTDWPMTMADLASALVSTGVVDIVIEPIEFDVDGNYGRINVYNGDYGLDLTSTVAFQYGMGLHNIRALRRNEDMSRLVNKLWYYLGPIQDIQHWLANITATQDFTIDFPLNPNLIQNPSPCPYDAASAPPYNVDVDAIRALIATSRGETVFSSGVFDPMAAGSFDVRMEVRTYDSRANEANLGYCLFKRLWLIEQFLRLKPLELVHITPTRDTAIGDFTVGDLVLVEANADVRGGFSGAQRIYQYTIDWDQDSVPAIGELQVSSDNEGFGA